MANSALTNLLCKTGGKAEKADACIESLGAHVAEFERLSKRLLENAPEREIVSYGAFVGRALLESGLTAIMLRFDPFRSGAIHRLARHPSYDPNVQFRHRVQWTGDIFASEKAANDLWSPDQKPDAIDRAIFADHFVDVVWVPAAEAMLDFLEKSGEAIDIGYFQSQTPKVALSRYRGEIGQLYSFLSKGVHGEFFLSAPSPLDPATGKEKLLATLEYLAQLGFAARFARGYSGELTPKSALVLYKKVRAWLDD